MRRRTFGLGPAWLGSRRDAGVCSILEADEKVSGTVIVFFGAALRTKRAFQTQAADHRVGPARGAGRIPHAAYCAARRLVPRPVAPRWRGPPNPVNAARATPATTPLLSLSPGNRPRRARLVGQVLLLPAVRPSLHGPALPAHAALLAPGAGRVIAVGDPRIPPSLVRITATSVPKGFW